MTKLLIVSL